MPEIDVHDAADWGVQIPPRTEPTPMDAGDLDSEPESPIDRLSRLLGTVAADDRASVRLYRMRDGHSHKLDWCKTYGVREFEDGGDLELIRREWGPGDYQIRLYGARHPSKGGGVGLIGKEDVGIVADPRAVAAPVVQQNAEVANALKSLIDNQNAMIARLSERPDPMQNLSATFALVAQMREAFGMTNNPAPAGAKSQLSEIVAAIRELREVSSEINPPAPEADSSGGLLPMAGQVLELVKASMQAKQNGMDPGTLLAPVAVPSSIAYEVPTGHVPRVAPRHANPAPSNAAPTPPAPLAADPSTQAAPAPIAQGVAIPDEHQMTVEMLRAQLKQVIDLAKSGATPQQGVDLIYEKLPDELIDLLSIPQWFELLCQFEPECKACETWIRAAVAIVLAQLREDGYFDDAPEDGAQDPGAAGDGPTLSGSAP